MIQPKRRKVFLLCLNRKEHNFQHGEQGKMEIDIRPLLEKI